MSDEIVKHGAPSIAAFGTHAFAKLRLAQAAMAICDISIGDPQCFRIFLRSSRPGLVATTRLLWVTTDAKPIGL